MPTPENVAAFAKLADARERLHQITRKLTEAPVSLFLSGKERQRREKLEEKWELAYEEFKTATDAFFTTVHNMQSDLKVDG